MTSERVPDRDRVGSWELLARQLRPFRGSSAELFLDARVRRDLDSFGYSITDHRVPPSVVAELMSAFRQCQADSAADESDRFRALAIPGRSDADTLASRIIRAVLVPEIAAITDAASARTLPSVLQVKPPSGSSGLGAHQDAPLVDERLHSGYYVWVSLAPSTIENGALFMLPGSHRFARWRRVPNEADELARYRSAIRRHARIIESGAGQVIVFHNAMIHGSLTNTTDTTRVAASCVVMPRDTEMVVPIEVPGGRAGEIQLRRVDTDAYDAGEDPPVDLGAPVGRGWTDELTVAPTALDLVGRIQSCVRPGAPGVPMTIDHG